MNGTDVVEDRKAYKDMTDEEIKHKVRGIISSSQTYEQIRERIGQELGYPNPADIAMTSHRTEYDSMTMLMMHGPRGNTISV